MTRRCGKRRAKRKTPRSEMPRMLSRIDSFPLHRIAESVPSVFPSLLARYIPSASPSLSLSLYGLIPSFPRRARYIYRLVSPSGSCLYHTATSPGPLAVRPPKLSRRHDLCFLRPSGGLIPFCCRMCTCAVASSSRASLPLAAPFRFTREHGSPAHTIVCPRSSRSRWPPCPLASASFETSFQRFRHPPPSRSLLFFL